MTAESIEVLPIGAHITIGEFGTGLPAIVTAVTIYATGVQYEATWWANGERKQAWIHEVEILHSVSPRVRIGFNSQAAAG